MKHPIAKFLQNYLFFVLLFELGRVFFLVWNHSILQGAGLGNCLLSLAHGLRHDLSVAAYLGMLFGLLLIAAQWIPQRAAAALLRWYYGIFLSLSAFLLLLNACLYSFWGFPLDDTFLFYMKTPKEVFANLLWWQWILSGLALAALCWALNRLARRWILREKGCRCGKTSATAPGSAENAAASPNPDSRESVSGVTACEKSVGRRLAVSGALLLLTGALFLPMRGGLTVATMNVGQAYFSADMRLNHAAVNPLFSLFESVTTADKDFASQYRYMSDDQAAALFAGMTGAGPDAPSKLLMPVPADKNAGKTVAEASGNDVDGLSAKDPAENALFTTARPNIVLFVLEGFMSSVIEPFGGLDYVTPRLNEWCPRGVMFTHIYANSFRTDRGLVSVLSGYPAQPTTSIMKFPAKTQHLPSLPGTLQEEGYHLKYYYGGDADFTNMRSYLRAMGIEEIVSDVDFPLSERLSKWGAADDVLMQKVLADFADESQVAEPFFKVVQTSSSHEPFDVPMHRLADPMLNSCAYTDSCLGDFLDRLSQAPWWDRTVVVLVPDHCMAWPEGIAINIPERYQIPLAFVGGAVRDPRVVEAYGSQIDLAPTLLAQLGLDASAFRFGRDLMDASLPKFGWFDFKNGFGMATPDAQLVYDCDADGPSLLRGDSASALIPYGKAFLQTLYDDLSRR